MSKAQSLAKILEKQGGIVKTGGESAILSEIANLYEGESGAALPEVTADDNGKVLTVVDGEWDKATPNAPLIVELTPSDSAGVYTTDIRNSEIINALTANKHIRFVRIIPDRYSECYLTMYRVSSGTVYINLSEPNTGYKYESAGALDSNAVFSQTQ